MAQSHCSIHNTFPEDNEPCWQCVNPIVQQRDDLLQSCKDTRFIINADPNLHYLKAEPWFQRLDAAIRKVEGA